MDDLISREAVLDMLDDINNHINEGCKYRHDWCVEWVNGLPSIDAVKHGRWIKMSDADGQYYCCSECGEELYRKWTFDREFDIFPHKKSIEKTMYCSNCGAIMDGRGES